MLNIDFRLELAIDVNSRECSCTVLIVSLLA